jgi:nucleoside-diphosphate-sugar epimerase
MRALLTGATGFCGRHLAAYLAADDVEVYSMSVHAREALHAFRIASTTDIQGMCSVLKRCAPDFVFHLAGTTCAETPVDFYRVNTLFAVSLLEAMNREDLSGVPVLLVGSAAELGPVRESDLPLTECHPAEPVSHYGASKLAQTNAGLTAARMGRPVVMARPFNIIGPGVSKQLVVGKILDQIAHVKSNTSQVRLALGNIDTTRDFIDIEDVTACYWDLIRTPAAYGQVVNVCTGQETSIQQVIDNLASLTGLELVVDEVESLRRANDISRHFGDNQRLQQIIARRPTLNLSHTLRRSLSQEALLQ